MPLSDSLRAFEFCPRGSIGTPSRGRIPCFTALLPVAARAFKASLPIKPGFARSAERPGKRRLSFGPGSRTELDRKLDGGGFFHAVFHPRKDVAVPIRPRGSAWNRSDTQTLRKVWLAGGFQRRNDWAAFGGESCPKTEHHSMPLCPLSYKIF